MPPTILVADDEPIIAEMLAELFEDEGFVVRRARDGAEALAMVERDPPDLIIADVAMPGMDGEQLARRVAVGGGRIPVVLISAHRRAVALPGVVFVAKPFALDPVVALVRRLLAGGGA